MRKFFLFFLIFINYIFLLSAQTGLKISKDMWANILEFHKQTKQSEVLFYSVQIKISQDKRILLEERNRFVNFFPEINVYQIYEQPYFKARVGKYTNRIEAEGLKQMIQEKFPSAHIVRTYE